MMMTGLILLLMLLFGGWRKVYEVASFLENTAEMLVFDGCLLVSLETMCLLIIVADCGRSLLTVYGVN